MAKSLLLMRHGEAYDSMGGEKDFDRALSPAGYRVASKMGKLLLDHKINPDLIISSPAPRAKTTAELVAEQLKFDVYKIEFNEEVYEASTRTLLSIINHLPEEYNTILVVGHNPGFTYLAEFLTKTEIGNIVNCGIVHIHTQTPWAKVGEGNCTLNSYEKPM